MGNKKKHLLSFAGLSIGKHTYQYNIGDEFFEELTYSEVKKGKVLVHVTLTKQSAMLLLDFEIDGVVKVACDRCNENFNLPIQNKYQLVVKTTGENASKEDEDVLVVPREQGEIDLSHYLYEYILLSLPIKRVHPDDKNGNATCNEEVLKHFVGSKNKKANEIDPRWEELLKLKKKYN